MEGSHTISRHLDNWRVSRKNSPNSSYLSGIQVRYGSIYARSARRRIHCAMVPLRLLSGYFQSIDSLRPYPSDEVPIFTKTDYVGDFSAWSSFSDSHNTESDKAILYWDSRHVPVEWAVPPSQSLRQVHPKISDLGRKTVQLRTSLQRPPTNTKSFFLPCTAVKSSGVAPASGTKLHLPSIFDLSQSLGVLKIFNLSIQSRKNQHIPHDHHYQCQWLYWNRLG